MGQREGIQNKNCWKLTEKGREGGGGGGEADVLSKVLSPELVAFTGASSPQPVISPTGYVSGHCTHRTHQPFPLDPNCPIKQENVTHRTARTSANRRIPTTGNTHALRESLDDTHVPRVGRVDAVGAKVELAHRAVFAEGAAGGVLCEETAVPLRGGGV